MAKRAVILTEGGSNIGFGHVTRSLSVGQAFKEKGINTSLLINADKSVRSILKNAGIDYALFDWLKYRDRLYEYVYGADILLIDSYLAGSALYGKLSRLIGTCAYIDDYKRINYPKGMIINGSLYACSLGYKKSKDKMYLLSTKYMPLRKEFWSECGRKVNKSVKNILVTFGGMNNGAQFANELVGYLKDKFTFNFISLLNRNSVGAKAIRDLMLGADVCISAGGQTTYELARCGIPTIGVSLADNQLLNLKSWAKVGFLDFAGQYKDKNIFMKIENSLRQMRYQRRLAMSRAGKCMVNGSGARNIVTEIIRCAKRKL